MLSLLKQAAPKTQKKTKKTSSKKQETPFELKTEDLTTKVVKEQPTKIQNQETFNNLEEIQKVPHPYPQDDQDDQETSKVSWTKKSFIEFDIDCFLYNKNKFENIKSKLKNIDPSKPLGTLKLENEFFKDEFSVFRVISSKSSSKNVLVLNTKDIFKVLFGIYYLEINFQEILDKNGISGFCTPMILIDQTRESIVYRENLIHEINKFKTKFYEDNGLNDPKNFLEDKRNCGVCKVTDFGKQCPYGQL